MNRVTLTIIVIKNVNDILCLPRAIAVGIAYAKYQNDKLNNDLKKRFHTMKKKMIVVMDVGAHLVYRNVQH